MLAISSSMVWGEIEKSASTVGAQNKNSVIVVAGVGVRIVSYMVGSIVNYEPRASNI